MFDTNENLPMLELTRVLAVATIAGSIGYNFLYDDMMLAIDWLLYDVLPYLGAGLIALAIWEVFKNDEEK